MAIKWQPPDGAFSHTLGKAGGGGIVRDLAGKMLVAFATPLQAHSALEAELKAIHHGLILAKEFNHPIWLEVDCEQALNLLNGVSWGPPQVRHDVARLIVLKRQITLRASFIHREGNNVVDSLAKMGTEKTDYQRMTASSAPRLVRAMVRMEEMGMPNIRIRGEDPT
ncbi:uncharacterized protein LOC121752882 [Salvia splendens]|uniref:uncharacterized protein LOC121752882 n=1 Tax=Salvia splendens TaxID=180675 RepID=UPI001C27812E|nr:uncharacterized protein LOC121752882 [Salvia splendens]